MSSRLTWYERRAVEKDRDEALERADACDLLADGIVGRLDAAIASATDPELRAAYEAQRAALIDTVDDHLRASARAFRDRANEIAQPLGDADRAETVSDYFAGLGVRAA